MELNRLVYINHRYKRTYISVVDSRVRGNDRNTWSFPWQRESWYDLLKDIIHVAAFFERKDIVLSFVLTQNERTKEKVKTAEKYG